MSRLSHVFFPVVFAAGATAAVILGLWPPPLADPSHASGWPLAPRPAALGCTAFVVRAGASVRVGKNLDWPIGDGAVLANPRGLRKTAWVSGSESPASWVSRYASVTFNQLGREFPLGGLNEAGLVVEELGYAPARYPAADGRSALNEMQWIQYQLDTHATVREVVSDSAVRIAPFLFGLHYLIADAAGDAAVIEFVDGARVAYTGDTLPVAVLANDSYRNLVRYLGLHAGFGGERRVGAGRESPERFVRAAMAVRRLEAEGRAAGAIPPPHGAAFDSAFAVLADVSQDDTQWSIVYDPVGLEVRWRTRDDPAQASARLADLAGDCGRGVRGRPLGAGPRTQRAAWAAWDARRNRGLVARVFAQMEALDRDGIPSPHARRAVAEYPGTLTCSGGP